MNMEPFQVYRHYLALKLHFTTEKYDVIEQQGRVKASKNAFLKRNDLFAIRKIAETLSDEEVIKFLVSNFITGDKWGGVFDTRSKEVYEKWKRRTEALSYVFEQEVTKIVNNCVKYNIRFEDCFKIKAGLHPYILKMYLKGDVSIETLVILNELTQFGKKFDEEMSDDLVWPDISRIIRKYTPFLHLKNKKEKYGKILRSAIGSE